MVSRSVINSVLVLRIVTLAASAATVALLVTNTVEFDDGSKQKFQDAISYRYVVAIAAIVGAYCIVQLPFAIYYAIQEKRLIRNGFLPQFDFFGDKVISWLLATGIGAGFAVSIEFKRFFDEIFDDASISKDDPSRSANNKYFVRGIIASGVLSVAFVAMVVVSIISSINRSRSKGIFG